MSGIFVNSHTESVKWLKQGSMNIEVNVENIRNFILSNIKALPFELLEAAACAGRLSGTDILAAQDNPMHDESIRDGFVLCGDGKRVGEDLEYSITGEIAAGAMHIAELANGTASRIFTGAPVPKNGVRVVPFEECIEKNGSVIIRGPSLTAGKSFIKKAGNDIKSSEVLFHKGRKFEIEHQVLLSSAGVNEVTAATFPHVACFCTGSELVKPGASLRVGQKTCSNGVLLEKLIPCFGGVVDEYVILRDDKISMDMAIQSLCSQKYDLCVTTGGMGPGKYDLVMGAFQNAGGEVLLDSLPMRPGKSILFGRMGKTIFLGLPGPPHAVRTLLYEILGPILLIMQGAANPCPQCVEAYIKHDFRVKKNEIMQLKDGVFSFLDGRCEVRLTGRLEVGNCFIIFERGKEIYQKEEKVKIHLLMNS